MSLSDHVNVDIPVHRVADIDVVNLTREETAALYVDIIRGYVVPPHFPVFATSVNGEVISRFRRSPRVRELMGMADLVSADGQPMVITSRLLSRNPLKERVATTDLFHDVSRFSRAMELRYFLLGATASEIESAARNIRRAYPRLQVVGYSHGYLSRADEEEVVVRINRLAPDILWLGMGVPREQEFVARHRHKLGNVKIVKTSGGLFNYLSGSSPRAPVWMQRMGLEWMFRLWLEPRRLFWRYLTTNAHSLYLLLTQTR